MGNPPGESTKAHSWQDSTALPKVVIRYVHHHPMGSTKHQDTRYRWLLRRISRCHNPRNLGEVFVFPLFFFRRWWWTWTFGSSKFFGGCLGFHFQLRKYMWALQITFGFQNFPQVFGLQTSKKVWMNPLKLGILGWEVVGHFGGCSACGGIHGLAGNNSQGFFFWKTKGRTYTLRIIFSDSSEDIHF